MSTKNAKKKTEKHARHWTDEELELFVEILANDENSFAFSLEQMALKNHQTMKCLSTSK